MNASALGGQPTQVQLVQPESSSAIIRDEQIAPPRPVYYPPPFPPSNINVTTSSQPAQALPIQTSFSPTASTGTQEVIIGSSSLLPQEQEISAEQNVLNVIQDSSTDQLSLQPQQDSSKMTSFQYGNVEQGFLTEQNGSSLQQVSSIEQDGSSKQQFFPPEQDISSQQHEISPEIIQGGSSQSAEQEISIPIVEVQQNVSTQSIDFQDTQLDVAIPTKTNLI
ncbi:hypothetical protein K501DRAFT_280511 [Backusella circina FSU 941]|nr:hypothetical protein K501DRAFT_280511 [Backusella circina FSU 941]